MIYDSNERNHLSLEISVDRVLLIKWHLLPKSECGRVAEEEEGENWAFQVLW
jgi:hypothetical protein